MADPNSTAPAAPFEARLADGSVVKAENVEEAFKTVAKMKEDTAAALKAEREQREQLTAQVAALQSKIDEATRPPTKDGEFDKNQYYRLLSEDPTAAFDYAAEHSRTAQEVRQMQADINVFKQETVAAAFLQQHYEDFPAGPEAAKALTQQVAQLVESGFPLSVETLNYAYNQLIEAGTVKPLEPEKEPPAESPANPALRGAGGTGISDAELDKFEKMTDKEQEAYLRNKGLLA